MIRRRTFRQDSEPSERIVALEYIKHAIGNTGPADSVKAVAACDEITTDLVLAAFAREPDFRLIAGQVVDSDITDLEQQGSAIREAAFDEVLHDLLLAVDGDALVHQRFEVDAMQITVNADIDAPMQHALALHPFADPQLGEQIRRPVFNQARANSIFNVIAAAILDDDRVDTLQPEESRKHEASRACSDDSDLRPHDGVPDEYARRIGVRLSDGKGMKAGKPCTIPPHF